MKKKFLLTIFLCSNIAFSIPTGQEFYYKAVLANDRGDYFEAGEFYLKACNRGFYQGCYNLAKLYHQGLGFRQNFSQAQKYYERGCSGDDSESCYSLAYMYHHGQGVRQNYETAAKYYTKSCLQDNAKSCDSLGDLYYKGGWEFKKNRAKAQEAYGKACDLGLQSGCDHYRGHRDEGVLSIF